ncbi:uncharacterized protein Tco025E_09277 [Trypanosoma conorhini]|uniref:Uncharacterized protein n=1 Tax=Trypanosoma conorhini TaxID=83891 RepID=A0A3R7M8Q4_9TRYP|nr:uncharacterized protein Tco025E_09277 [Trypanosoma conorhini]RNE98192.1 hypothetical protein Tco025E_09277 [Trypanosoma conorhini]
MRCARPSPHRAREPRRLLHNRGRRCESASTSAPSAFDAPLIVASVAARSSTSIGTKAHCCSQHTPKAPVVNWVLSRPLQSLGVPVRSKTCTRQLCHARMLQGFTQITPARHSYRTAATGILPTFGANDHPNAPTVCR